MTDVVTIPVQPLGALFFATLMSLHAGLLGALLEDDIPLEGHETLVAIGGWLWWAILLCLVAAA